MAVADNSIWRTTRELGLAIDALAHRLNRFADWGTSLGSPTFESEQGLGNLPAFR